MYNLIYFDKCIYAQNYHPLKAERVHITPKMSLTTLVSVKFSFQAPGKHQFTGKHHTLISHFQSQENEKVIYATSCCLAYFTEENVLVLFKQILKKLLFVWKGHLCFMKIDLTFILPNFYGHQQFISEIFLFCFAFTLVRISIVQVKILDISMFLVSFLRMLIYMYTYVFINEVYS